jgi:Uri superfamily endonuclease
MLFVKHIPIIQRKTWHIDWFSSMTAHFDVALGQ